LLIWIAWKEPAMGLTNLKHSNAAFGE
jgi:hypothetical protein